MPRSLRLCGAVHKHYVSHKCCQTSTPWGPPPRPPTHRMTTCVQWLSTVGLDLRSGRKCKSVCPGMLTYQVVCLSVSMCTCVRRPTLERQSVKHAHRLSVVLWAHVHGCMGVSVGVPASPNPNYDSNTDIYRQCPYCVMRFIFGATTHTSCEP